jgi:two-component system response regulator MtrA
MITKPNRILVVDDEQPITELIKATLDSEEFDINVANDGQVALAYLEQYRPDLVILDLKMPGLSGFEVLKWIRKRANFPVIILTSMSDADTLSKSFLLGADDFVKKPFQAEELVARVRAKIRRAKNSN